VDFEAETERGRQEGLEIENLERREREKVRKERGFWKGELLDLEGSRAKVRAYSIVMSVTFKNKGIRVCGD